MFIKSGVLPQAVPPAYCSRKSATGKHERLTTTERGLSSPVKQVPQCGMAAKLVPEIALDIDSNPFLMTRAGVNKVEHVNDRIAIDTDLLQTKTQYNGFGGAATTVSHGEVGVAQYGATRMY